MQSSRQIRDDIGFFNDAAPLREVMVRVITRVQDARPANQILGIAAALVAIADGLGLDPHDLLIKVGRAKRNLDTPFAKQFAAMTDYARGELSSGV